MPVQLSEHSNVSPIDCQECDWVRAICQSLVERGWFVDVKASKISEHFTINGTPEPGWALKEGHR